MVTLLQLLAFPCLLPSAGVTGVCHHTPQDSLCHEPYAASLSVGLYIVSDPLGTVNALQAWSAALLLLTAFPEVELLRFGAFLPSIFSS